MSNNQQSQSYTSYSTTSYTTSSSSNGAQPHTQSYSESANYNSRDGGSLIRESRETGQPTLREETQIPVQGRVGGGGAGAADESRKIEDVTDADREYLERMEDEYAKREGGA